MSRKTNTGEGDPYEPDDEANIQDYLDDSLDAYYDMTGWVEVWDEDDDSMEAPSRLEVYAEVEWAGTFNRSALRLLRADGLDLRQVVTQVAKARASVTSAVRLKSYDARTLQGKLHQLQRTQAGREFLAGAGVTRRAIRSWERGTARPSKASREKIEQAYESAAMRYVTRAAERSAAAAHRIAEALTDALTDRYGAVIHIRQISSMELS